MAAVAYQRKVLTLALTFDSSGLLQTRLLLWGEMKKSGKTALGAPRSLVGMTRGPCEVVVLANDLEQSQSRVFGTMVALLKANGFDKARTGEVLASEIRCRNGSVIHAVASDYKGEAGGRQTLSLFDEMWGYSRAGHTALGRTTAHSHRRGRLGIRLHHSRLHR